MQCWATFIGYVCVFIYAHVLDTRTPIGVDVQCRTAHAHVYYNSNAPSRGILPKNLGLVGLGVQLCFTGFGASASASSAEAASAARAAGPQQCSVRPRRFALFRRDDLSCCVSISDWCLSSLAIFDLYLWAWTFWSPFVCISWLRLCRTGGWIVLLGNTCLNSFCLLIDGTMKWNVYTLG